MEVGDDEYIVVFEDVTREMNVTSLRTSIYIYQHWKHHYVYQLHQRLETRQNIGLENKEP